jgi:crotonobetainyl-CoA:carnitine CoA-transferase CaiB-like acyl-CoA transferase
LAGIRVFDMTSFWAGSYASQIMGFFGADVIKVESVQRPDGTRLATSYSIEGDQLWERAPLFHSCNTNKRDITLDLGRPEGRDLARRLLAECDVLIENYTPRVLDGFDIVDPERDDLIVVRMPAWGLSGPWRDLPGFAQTMEQATGLAWLTGFADGPPILPRGPCDPIGGLHGAFATIAALRDRDRTGLGQVIEAPLVEPALNVAAEQFVEYSAYGRLLERQGNRSNRDAPHGVYRCTGDDRWLAVAVDGDDQWFALRAALGQPAWSDDERFTSALGRLAAEAEIDENLAAWCATQDRDAALAVLRAAGVPAAPMVEAEEILDVDQITHRSFYETVEHAVIGSIRLPGFPARLASHPGPIHRHPAPLLGQHNREVFAGLLGLSDETLDALTEADIIGTRPVG